MAPAEKKPRASKATTEPKTTKPKVARARKPKVAAVTGEQVAERAYYIWVDSSEGDAFAHWVQAERELMTA